MLKLQSKKGIKQMTKIDFLQQLFLRLFQRIKSYNSKIIIILIFTFLLMRLILGTCYGTQDVEWWKAWSVESVTNGLTNVYGASDSEIINKYKEGKTTKEVLESTQKIIHYKPKDYERVEYKVTQPPIYIYSLYIVGNLYQVVSPSMENNRLFNFFLNLIPAFFSILTTFVIYLFVKSISTREIAILTAGAYWLSPLVLLNSPIQGYFDPIIAFFVTASFILLYKKHLSLSYVFLVLGVLSKPTAIIVFPVLFWIGLKDYPFKKNLIAWFFSFITVLIILLPFILNGRALSVFQGVWSINESSQDLSRQSMNLWWLVQYSWTAIHNLYSSDISSVSAIMGGPGSNWINDIPSILLGNILGFNVQNIGFILWGLFTILNLWFISVKIHSDRKAIFVAAGLQIYAYFILRVGVQTNHYFVLIPLFCIVSMLSFNKFKYYLLISAIFLMQDFLIYGFGRDFNHGRSILTLFYAGWISNLLAFANIALFIWICFKEFSPYIRLRSRDYDIQKTD